MRNWKLILLLALTPLLYGCPSPVHYDPYFISVFDNLGSPLVGVQVWAYEQGGSDWGLGHYERHLTDQNGRVELDGSSEGDIGYLLRANHFPMKALLIADSTYIMTATPSIATPVAELEGERFFFYKDFVISLTKAGFYRCYSLGVNGVTSPVSLQLRFVPNLYSADIYGDDLWLSNYNRWLYRYDLSDPAAPELKGEYSLPGQGFIKAADENLLLASGAEYGRVVIYEVTNTQLIRLSTIPVQGYPEIYLKNKRLLMLDNDGVWGWDLTVPDDPLLVNPLQTGRNESAVFLDSVIFCYISSTDNRDSSTYQVYSLADACYPVELEQVVFPGRLSRIVDLDHGFVTFSLNNWEYLTNGNSNYVVRSEGSTRFVFAGYLIGGVVAAQGEYSIGSDTLYKWESR